MSAQTKIYKLKDDLASATVVMNVSAGDEIAVHSGSNIANELEKCAVLASSPAVKPATKQGADIGEVS